MSCGVAVAPIRPLAWEPSHAAGAALKKEKKKKKMAAQFSNEMLPVDYNHDLGCKS